MGGRFIGIMERKHGNYCIIIRYMLRLYNIEG